MDASLRCGCLFVALVAIWMLKTRLNARTTSDTGKAPPDLVAPIPWELSSRLSRVRRVSFAELQREMKHAVANQENNSKRTPRPTTQHGSPHNQRAHLNLPTATEVFQWIARKRIGPLLVTDSPSKTWPATRLWYNKTDRDDPYKYISQRVNGNFTV